MRNKAVPRGPIRIHPKHGYIVGGQAEKRLRGRIARERGKDRYINWLEDNNAIERKPYYIKILFVPKEKRKQWWTADGEDIQIEFGIYATRDFCRDIEEHKMLGKWLHIRTFNSRLKKWLDYYGTDFKGMAGWEKHALKDKDLIQELKEPK